MFVIISATNRINSSTKLVAEGYQKALQSLGIEDIQMISLENMNDIQIKADMFAEATVNPMIKTMQAELLIPSTHWLIVVPEYNGSFPGILKLWIDMLSISKRNETFKGKKISMVGVASGRSGNLRGLDQLTGLLNYLGSYMMPNKLPMSSIHTFIDKENHQLLPSGLETIAAFAQEIKVFYDETVI